MKQHATAIVLAFTLKGQDADKIIEQIEKVAQTHAINQPIILIHGFMPRKEVEAKQFPTSVIDTFDRLFPIQLNMYQDGPLREAMADAAGRLRANVIVIGEELHGVADEVKLYREQGLSIYYQPLT